MALKMIFKWTGDERGMTQQAEQEDNTLWKSGFSKAFANQ
jgi:hypothetical protein